MCYKLLNAHQPVQNSLPIGRQVPLKDRRGAMAGLLPGSANAYIDGVTMILSPRDQRSMSQGWENGSAWVTLSECVCSLTVDIVSGLRSMVKYGDQGQSGQAIKLFQAPWKKISFAFHYLSFWHKSFTLYVKLAELLLLLLPIHWFKWCCHANSAGALYRVIITVRN